jgi:hypothetical protein
MGNVFLQIKQFFFFIEFSLSLCPIESLGSKICATGSFFVLDFYRWLRRFWDKSRSGNGSTLSELGNIYQVVIIRMGY